MGITATHDLLTGSWTAAVEAIEAAVGRFRTDHASGHDCHVVLFEMAEDEHLHVNVMHKHKTKRVPGWAGPASLPEGFVHNRRFTGAQPADQIVGHVRDAVFAPSI